MQLSSNWYKSLIDDAKSAWVESLFTSHWAKIEGYHIVGGLLRSYADKMPMTELVEKSAIDMNISKSLLWDAVRFYDKYPSLDRLPEGKSITWSKIRTKYLPDKIEEKVKPKSKSKTVCKCGYVIALCPKCGEIL